MTSATPNASPNALGLFEAALGQPPSQRRAWIEAAAADPAAHAAALDLLAAHDASAGFLEPVPTPRRLGPYRLLEPLGHGGMGQVWLAERDDGAFEQRVAIKVLASVLGDADSIRRAESERQFLAWLDHPHIARVLDGGATPQGQPYVVMEYVAGERIDDWCRAHALDPRARVELFLQVLAAVDAAHRALIIHRDIKPANVLVDAQGQAKLLDFGIAKSLDERLAGVTRTGLTPLTPEYASPEQLLGRPLTTACDVYALGLVLDELLTGRALHAGLGPTELLRRIEAGRATRPSLRIDAPALGLAPRALADWKKRLAGDLDRVVLKALEAEPRRRYESARAFADDLERWLAHRPVQARAGGFGYRAAKFVRRNRWAVTGASAALGAILLGGAAALYQAQRARVAAERAERGNEFLIHMIGDANPFYGGKEPLLVDAIDRAVPEIPQRLAGQPLLEADIRRAIGQAYAVLNRNDDAKVQLDLAASLRARAGGNEYAQILQSQAYLEWQLGRYEKAEPLYRQALAQCTADARGRRQRSDVLNDYAALLSDTGRYAQALPLAEEALRLKESQPDTLPRDHAVGLSNVANALDGLGHLDESLATYQRALRELEAIAPRPELDIGIALSNLAYVQDEMGRFDEAVESQERAVALNRKVLGVDQGLTIKLGNLAHRYLKVGRHAEAQAAIAEALRLAANTISADDWKSGNLHATAAKVALARGDAAEAIAQAKTALAIYDRTGTLEPGRRERVQATLDAAIASSVADGARGRR